MDLRAVSSAVLIGVASLLAPISVVSVWTASVVSQTDRYVETVAPIAADPDVQAAVAEEVSAAIIDALDVPAVTSQTLEVLAGLERMPPRAVDALAPLAVSLTNAVEESVRTQTRDLVADPRFETLWAQANRGAHTRLVALLEGEQGGVVTAQENQITLELAPVIAAVAARLVDAGFAPAANLPPVQRTFVLVESDAIGRAQRFYAVLTALGRWLPVAAGTLLLSGVLLARDRRRALLRGALGVAAATATLGLGLTLVMTLSLDASTASTLTVRAAENVLDTLLRFLRTGLRVTVLTALLVALAAVAAGPSSAAVRMRSAVGRGVRYARQAASAGGTPPPPGRAPRRPTGRTHHDNHPRGLAREARRRRHTGYGW